MAETSFDCVVVGAGPGGYVAAIRAAQLGMKTAVVERESLGGICLNWGCIPTKALLKSAELYRTISHASDFGLSVGNVGFDFPAVIRRSRGVVDRMTKGVQFLMRKNKIEVFMGTGRFKPGKFIVVTGERGETALQFKKAIVATGGRARTLANLPVDGERVITYRHALELPECPKKLLVVGAGAIGIEFAYFFASFGSEVTIVEIMEHILPIEDQEISQALEKSLARQNIQVRTKTFVESLERKGQTVSALLKSGDRVEQWSGDYCLVAIGVQGNVEGLGLEAIGIHPERSFLRVDKYYQTSDPDIYAIGDVIGPPLLAHVASHEGIIAAEHAAGLAPHPMNYTAVPGCTYCQPQVASIGLTEKQARDTGISVRVGKFPFSASGKAVATNETDGFVKVIVDEKIEEIVGVHIIHAEATELIGEASLMKSHEATATSVFQTIHAHPTLTEALMEAAGDALGRAIHI